MSEEVKKMFADIANTYDLLNSVMSFGTHNQWRKKAVKLAGVQNGWKALDTASGTGDLAIVLKEKVGNQGEVIATDFCVEMLDLLEPKAKKLDLDITREFADVMKLKYQDDYFDISSISFGIRNVDDPKVGISEMARVVRPNGKVLVIETGRPNGLMGIIYRFFSENFMPFVGNLLASKKSAYTYLPKTISKFPCGDEFVSIMNSTNSFSFVESHPIMFGAVWIYIGTVK